jgi:transposase
MTRFLKADFAADRFSWSVDEDAVAEAELFDGKLALLTNAPDLRAADAVARYKALADIERGFRVLKSDIEIAPVHHRLPDRIRAHALICFLALTLYRVMRMRLKADRPSTAAAAIPTVVSGPDVVPEPPPGSGRSAGEGLDSVDRHAL